MRRELSLSANVLFGYDDNLTAGYGTGAGSISGPVASGSTGYLDGTLDYFRGNRLRSMEVHATGDLRAYPAYLDQPAPGGTAALGGRTTIGRDLTLRASERIGYEPLFNAFSSGATSGALPPGMSESAPETGLFERRSFSSHSLVGLHRQWGGDSASLTYWYKLQEFTEDDYGDSQAHDVRTEYRRELKRGLMARAEYEYVNREYVAADGASLPTREHRLEAGPDIEQVFSRRRYLNLRLGAGASHVAAVSAASGQPYESWVPVGSAELLLGLSPHWSVEGGYRRDFSTFQGVTDEVYGTDTAYIRTGGLVTGQTDLRLGATYSNWRTAVASGVDDRFHVYGASLQVVIPLTTRLAAYAGYLYYHHRYSNPASLPTGFPSEYDRHAVRIGMTLWVPVVGSPPRAPLTAR